MLVLKCIYFASLINKFVGIVKEKSKSSASKTEIYFLQTNAEFDHPHLKFEVLSQNIFIFCS